jgi:signal transduction histidine kinase
VTDIPAPKAHRGPEETSPDPPLSLVELYEQRIRYETAIAECAQALLASRGDNRIEKAMEALLKATEATYVFLERNVVDPDLGFCSQAVCEVEASDTPGSGVEDHYWDLVPWERMPTSREHLEQGRPFVVIPELLEGPEYEVYAADPWPVKAELDIPIFVDGEWAGLIGFSDHTVVRDWNALDLSLLSTAAKMVGAFWEREASREQLQELNEAKDEFLASIGHELRTPLTSVVGYAQLLRDHADRLSPEQRQEAAETVLRQAGDLTNLVSDLLSSAQAEIGQLSVTRVPVNLRAQAAQIMEDLTDPRADSIRLSGYAKPAVGDPARARQILRNLVGNALRYGGEQVRIEVCERKRWSCAMVIDDGPGVPPQDRERIFHPHQRSGTAPGLTASLGLGLSISRRLARLMGGDVTYHYQDGESIFELSLPAG